MATMKFDLDGVKIPKKIAGVKVPKRLRKTGKKLLAKANSPQGREAIAAGLTIAGAAIAAKAQAKAARAAGGSDIGAGAGSSAAKHAGATPVRPGEPGINPQLNDAIAAGVGALQRFLVGGSKAG